MEFDPNNNVVKICLQGLNMEEQDKPDDARKLFHQAWDEAIYDFEKFISAHYVSRHQKNDSDKLKWLETALQIALKINNDTVNSALPSLYSNIARCCEATGDQEKAKSHYDLATSIKNNPSDKGPFFHGTRADLQIGDFLLPGGNSNYDPELKMNHIYFTALVNGAGLAAALAQGDGEERVYIVAPTAGFENDPNVTDKKFPGNPTRSYRSLAPLEIIGETTDWVRQPPEQLKKWRKNLANKKGKIIN